MKNGKKGTGGFTLVELIVVIAILAILAGVGTVAYSGYVKKANQAVDQQLVGDVAYALQLGAISDNGAVASGYVILRYQEAPTISESVASYLKDVFGEDLSTLQLKYDGWTDDGLVALAMSQQYAAAVGQSSYLQKSTVPELLDNVKTITTAASEFLAAQGDPARMYTNLQTALGGNFDTMLDAAGLRRNAEGTALDDSVTNAQISNLMVMCVAEELSGLNETQLQQLANKMLDPDAEAPQLSLATGMAVEYAAIKGFALQSGNTEAFDAMNAALSTATTMSQVSAAFQSFSQNADMSGYLDYMEMVFPSDVQALGAIMQAVDQVSDDYLDAGTLNNADLYTSGGVSDRLNTYVSAADAASSLSEEEKAALGGDGIISIFLTTMVDGTVSVGVAPAAAYGE